ncbi:transcription initiation factor TFIID subunit 7 [Sporothrix schenckii 1099-18]|uniref:TAFII55 protein conserved region domain-containing protein n=2 Tax=Sporothrix schenckii TaxID=29908 RepID=U7PKU7_SPOS1|nr:transcription initiation factor TFIID subunit 7 [Sporothrix schenckii 1099-18]ERS95536.1 hypothetical protein HMPREF1624_08052 [Sporothrix schenckii ATCC 58251]KJR86760.1 transcription initiation factor TFIID subunit 7 [Sporothrix schenckii 1099-18]
MASPPPPAKPSRPVTLKLRMPSAASPIAANPIVATPSAMSPPPATPGGGGMRIVLKRSQPPTPAVHTDGAPPSTGAPLAATATPTTSTTTPGIAVPPTPSTAATPTTPATVTTQKGRISKPSAKKRAHDFDESDDEGRPVAAAAKPARRALPNGSSSSQSGGAHAHPPKRPKLILKKSTLSRTASIVLKPAAKEAPPHSKGEGYDSEEEDREMDPLIEEAFVLRMLPGEQCDYLRRMVEERKIGVPAKDGGAEFDMKWLPGAERRALVTVQRRHFVGVLVDLPTITEGMKTWDKRNFMKSADICQMLLVYAPVAGEAEAKSAPLPAMVGKDYRWPHGLTPPMHDCIHRRFRKRLSKKEIKDKEAELQRLLNEDRLAAETKWELFDDGRTADEDEDGDEEEDAEMEMGEEDAEGEDDAYGEVDEDYFGRQQQGHGGPHGEADADGEIDEAELMAEFMEEDDDDKTAGAGVGAGAADGSAAGQPQHAVVAAAAAQGDAPTPASEGEAGGDGDADGDDDDEDDDDDDDLDEDEQARAEQAKGVREDINDLKKSLATLEAQLAATTNALLRKRIEGTRKRVLSELRLKQASIGEIDEEE